MYFLARQYCHATLDLLLSLARLSSTLVFTFTSTTTAYTIPFCILYFLRYRANCTLTKIYALISLFPLRWKIWHPRRCLRNWNAFCNGNCDCRHALNRVLVYKSCAPLFFRLRYYCHSIITNDAFCASLRDKP